MPPGRVICAITALIVECVKSYDHCSGSSTVLAAILDAILDFTAYRYSDFDRLLVCYSPPETVPETVEKPFLVFFFWGSTIFLPY